jgi:hypothetical protein
VLPEGRYFGSGRPPAESSPTQDVFSISLDGATVVNLTTNAADDAGGV